MLFASPDSPLLVGLTGGIGSGKSTIAKIFLALGIPVFNADEAGKSAYQQPEVLRKVVDLLGAGILNESGQADRKKIAALVFNDQHKLSALNLIIHPWVKDSFLKWMNTIAVGTPYLIRESAILLEAGLADEHDVIIQVTAPVETRIDRVTKRDQVAREDVLLRMSRQMSDVDRVSQCHFQIVNDGLTPVLPRVLQIHQLLSHESAQYRRNKKC
jgi:dephospho-CoA kinase